MFILGTRHNSQAINLSPDLNYAIVLPSKLCRIGQRGYQAAETRRFAQPAVAIVLSFLCTCCVICFLDARSVRTSGRTARALERWDRIDNVQNTTTNEDNGHDNQHFH
jgi:hypothetical protein